MAPVATCRPGRRASLTVTAAVLVTALAGLLGACGGGESDPDTTGPSKQAIEQLRDFGLTRSMAECVVDELGAATVVEAADLTALAESQAYQDAVKDCNDA